MTARNMAATAASCTGVPRAARARRAPDDATQCASDVAGTARRAARRAVGSDERDAGMAPRSSRSRGLCTAARVCIVARRCRYADGCAYPRPDAIDLSRRRPHAARRPRPAGAVRSTIRIRGLAAPCAAPEQRAIFDVSAAARRSDAARDAASDEDYPFVRVEGDGVHEIAVGPVHAGTIEPGHFRFPVVGEKVLRLEERLGYAHKGIEKRFTAVAAARGRIASRRASRGDSHGRVRLGVLPGARRASRGCECRRARAWLRALCSSASASPTTWATWARSATTPASPSGSRSSRGCKEDAPARQSRGASGSAT